MMASLFSGVSGLKNHQVKMNVIGNNIANLNTIGFKGSRVNFQEALVQTQKGAGRPSEVSGGTNPVQMGLGMEVSSVDTLFQQGGLETTGQITDLAIQGNGFFVLGDFVDNRYYTRAGAFGFDANANLVDPATGLMVLGKMANQNGEIPSLSTIGEITLPFDQQDPARATTSVNLANNIDASATNSKVLSFEAGNSNVMDVQGTAADGVGGTHTISVEGEQAKQASMITSTGGSLSLATTLTSLGVNVFDDLTIAVDGGTPQAISGLSATSTIDDLLNAINLIDGISAKLTGGEIEITRDYYGAPASFYFETSAGVDAGGNLNIASGVFGQADGAAFNSATQADVSRRGAATTFVATDSFVPTKGTGAASGPKVTQLQLVHNESTGLVTGLRGIGSGGISLTTGAGGLSYTYDNPTAPLGTDHPLVVETEATEHTTSIDIFDSQGEKHTMSITFFKSLIENRWEWSISTNGNEDVTTGESGYVTFNDDGSLNTFDYNGGATAVAIDPRNGAGNMSVSFDAGTSGNFDGLTQFSGSHTASIVSQDGYGLGILQNIAIDKAGYISGIFSNGITRVLAQIMLADFANQAGMRKTGKSMYQATGNSGEAREGMAGETIGAEIVSGALESSSVDVAQEFTSMITAQRGFQANARIITTSDSMLDELVNLKR